MYNVHCTHTVLVEHSKIYARIEVVKFYVIPNSGKHFSQIFDVCDGNLTKEIVIGYFMRIQFRSLVYNYRNIEKRMW